MTWPIAWPDSIAAAGLDPNIKKLCEVYASACMSALTLHRVGGGAVTIMPAGTDRVPGRYVGYAPLPDEYLVGAFYPGTLFPSAQDLQHAVDVREIEAVVLPGPVGTITEVKVGGVTLSPALYRVEDGKYLIRLDGEAWPAQGEGFTVTYTNSHPVSAMGAHAAGVLAAEWLKLLTSSKNCRLSANVTSVNRQGMSMEIAAGMFPEGVTGIPEVDAYLMLWNPYGLKTAPKVYSPDLPRHRQVWQA